MFREAAFALAGVGDWRELAKRAAPLREASWGRRISYSRKVFIPLTHLCRDVCHYCTFAKTPSRVRAPYLSLGEVLAIAHAGAAAGCKEALFTLGDKPEARYTAAARWLKEQGYDSTLEYLAVAARLVLAETGLLPHLNPGLLAAEDYTRLRPLAPSMGLMLESASERLCQRGGPHFGSPDKLPSRRLDSLRLAGAARVPMTSGILMGIGETRQERIESLLALRELHKRHGHLQEIIVQNFRAKPGTKMAAAAEPAMTELLWTVAAARIIFGGEMSIQAPPNLYGGDLAELIEAGINDWGGVSPVTPDHVNPEAPWPELARLAADTERAGCELIERLTVYPHYIAARDQWIDSGLHSKVLAVSDSGGYARIGRWTAGNTAEPDAADCRDARRRSTKGVSPCVAAIVEQAQVGREMSEDDVTELFSARGADFDAICHAAEMLRRETVGERITFVVNRNINYTNVCLYKCGFCAFSKGRAHDHLRGKPYQIERAELQRRVREAWDRGATEVCMQGGIHPAFTGRTYLDILRAAKEAAPQIHVHAFSPLEIVHGATTLGLPTLDYLRELKAAGLGSLPGTAAEILDDEVRAIICPDKLDTATWLRVVGEAHAAGLPTTATIMFGHVEQYRHWARHLLQVRRLQQRTQGLTEFVPLPFVHLEAPLFLRGLARKGPTLRETVLMHAVARLCFHGLIRNVQVSWVKMGPQNARRCLEAGANDLGGTLMNESISRAAGAAHGQELDPGAMAAVAAGCAGRNLVQRTTLYRDADHDRVRTARTAPALTEPLFAPLRRGTELLV
jgi:FO synthase